jgi:hypothetical protein
MTILQTMLVETRSAIGHRKRRHKASVDHGVENAGRRTAAIRAGQMNVSEQLR